LERGAGGGARVRRGKSKVARAGVNFVPARPCSTSSSSARSQAATEVVPGASSLEASPLSFFLNRLPKRPKLVSFFSAPRPRLGRTGDSACSGGGRGGATRQEFRPHHHPSPSSKTPFSSQQTAGGHLGSEAARRRGARRHERAASRREDHSGKRHQRCPAHGASEASS